MGIVLVLGGTKTGKTSFAENWASGYSDQNKVPVYYIATARPFDNEMVDRIAKHRASRPSHWETIEEPVRVAEVLEPLSGMKNAVILDCFTLLMTNLIFDRGDNCTRKEAEEAVFGELEKVIAVAASGQSELVIISNQVENGLVSEHKWARMFQDIAGMAHQKLAAASDKVYMMNAGLPLQLK